MNTETYGVVLDLMITEEKLEFSSKQSSSQRINGSTKPDVY